jgi:DNA mismatch repair ATPase MutL
MCFVNHRLVRDRLVLHALTEAYRNIIPPTSFPVVLLFLEMPPQEVDVNVHPAKTEVRRQGPFRQPGARRFVHDFIRDTVRTTLMTARPAASFAIKVNMRLEPEKIDWLLRELGKTEHPTSCPHGRPIALRYSLKDIQRAFQRI